ncbi:hypothetical protein GCK72_000167 [Caenorhabditis remanei]|uniref:Uncharacterized protein n=1 Tax=Caenorhabditis remanei TaxID=31234 RepID=A0A6A5HLD2_CAERE|nr:hypothetical protein GCK72_000167 [Caenorhabditis remanei]KAF1768355.1 hypothetical protein GCK72_000167 [Caenorhabditis remanei]
MHEQIAFQTTYQWAESRGEIIALTGKPVNDPKVANPVICNQGNRKLMENENLNKADKDALNRVAQCLHFSSGSNNTCDYPKLLHREVCHSAPTLN